MSEVLQLPTCIVIGASHAGVNFAFSLRREGWEGPILLFDADPELPYHRPPLSKTFLVGDEPGQLLKPAESYDQEDISLRLGQKVTNIDSEQRIITLDDGAQEPYDKLVLATGGRAIIPPIPGLSSARQAFPLRSAADAKGIRAVLQKKAGQQVVVIGGGYIGLEVAASIRKTGAEVVVVEREERVLARVTAPVMSTYFQELHHQHGVDILTGKNVTKISTSAEEQWVVCSDGTRLPADLIIVGVGIEINKELAVTAGVATTRAIRVDETSQTSNEHIYAIGDCTEHYNPHYDRYIRLESVQNAVDQAKVAAAAIQGKKPVYDEIPWFWSDQYDVKLQLVGLSDGYDEVIVRKEERDNCFSAWYFKGETLLAVDAVNNGKAYVLGMRYVKGGQRLDKVNLANTAIPFKPANLLLPEEA